MEKRKEMWRALPFVMALLLLTLVPAQSASALFGKSKEEVKAVLQQNGVSEQALAKFSVDYDEAFGFETQLHPKNVIDQKKFEIKTPDVVIKVDPARSDLIETRIIGGVKYILICADEDVEVNGVSIHIAEKEAE